MGKKYNILQLEETDILPKRQEDRQILFNRKDLKEAENRRREDTEVFYKQYFKPEMSHLAVSARKVNDKLDCLSNMFRSKEKIMNSWFMKYFHMSPQNASVKTLETCLEDLRNSKKTWTNKHNDPIEAPDPHVREMLITYTKVKLNERSMKETNKVDPKKAYSLAEDTTITSKQRKELERFQLWLQRNCDKTGVKGIKYGLGKKGPVRNFAEEFMKLPARVQLKTLFLLETGKRKSPNEYSDNMESQSDGYTPNLDKLKDTMIASKFKIFRRLNGSQFYWNKLQEAMGIAKQSEEKLTALSKNIKEDIEKLGGRDKKDIMEQTFQYKDAAMDVDREIEHTGEKWDDTKILSGYAGKAKTYYGLADNVNKVIQNNGDAVLVPNAGTATLSVGAVTSLIGLAGAVHGLYKSYDTSTKLGVASQSAGIAGAAVGAFNANVIGIWKAVDKTAKAALGTAGSAIGIGSGAIMMTKAGLDLTREGKNKKKASKVQKSIQALKNGLEQEHKKAVDDINNSAMRMDEADKAKELEAENERYKANVENMKLMEKAAQLSVKDAERKRSSGWRGVIGGGMVSGSSSVMLGVGLMGVTGLAAPITLGIGTAVGIGMAIEGAINEDKQQIEQNREYIDSEMYKDEKDKEDKVFEAQLDLEASVVNLWEPGSDEYKKTYEMLAEAKEKSEVFQDQMRDLYAAEQGYIHQSDAKNGIKGKMFGQVYDAAFKETSTPERDSEKRTRLNMQTLLRSQDLHVHHNEGKKAENQKEQPTREKAVSSIKKR